MQLTTSLVREYTPKFNGNQDLPAGDQIKIIHHAPSQSLKGRLIKESKIEWEVDDSGKSSGGKIAVEKDERAMIKTMTKQIIGLNVNGKDLINGTDLFGDDAPPEIQGLIDELYNYYFEILTRTIDSKN